jgi:hypothetical protein
MDPNVSESKNCDVRIHDAKAEDGLDIWDHDLL